MSQGSYLKLPKNNSNTIVNILLIKKTVCFCYFVAVIGIVAVMLDVLIRVIIYY